MSSDEIKKYVAVYLTMQRDHTLTIEKAAASQGPTVTAFRELEGRNVPASAHAEATFGALVIYVLDGRVRLVRPEPLSSLCALLDGKPAHLVGRCPICGQLFERLRKDQECDTRRYRDAHRKREWRAHQTRYEQNRQINGRVRGGMPLDRAKLEAQMKRSKH